MLNIGVFVDSFGKSADEGLQLAAEFGCRSFQVYVTRGDIRKAVEFLKAL